MGGGTGFQTCSSDGKLKGQVVGGMAQGSPILPFLFGALMVHKSKLTEATMAESAGVSAEDRTLGPHSGDGETHTGWGERFEHPTKTWACATHKQFTMQAVAVAIAKATRGKCEEAMREVFVM